MKCRGVVLLSLILASCGSNTGAGIICGAVVGGSAGAISGGGSSALIGTAAGVIAGGILGAVLDEQDRKVMERNSPRTVDRMDRGETLTLNDVIKLSQAGVSDDAIIRYMHETTSMYTLTQAQVRRLQDAGVSQRVINNMIASGK
jgi:outer membrane lipoprotein SlyB